jgi:hypothetical protein
MIRHYVAHRQDDWSTLLPALEFAYNSSKHRAIGVSPFYVYTGRNPVKFEELLLHDVSKSPAVGEHVGNMKKRAEAAATSILPLQRNHGERREQVATRRRVYSWRPSATIN